jgi:AraC-like DNA-binding protein
VVFPGGLEHECEARARQDWTLLWVEAAGEMLPLYLREMGVIDGPQLLRLGEDAQLVRLFHDVLGILKSGCALPRLLQASHVLGTLMAVVIERRQKARPQNQDIARKVAGVITYMSEHVHEPLSVSSLARLANLSPAYFGSIFRAHTGSSPRDYLHLLRIHRACQMLQDTTLNVKEIAANLGYQDQFHFSRQFKGFQGISPTQYRYGHR